MCRQSPSKALPNFLSLPGNNYLRISVTCTINNIILTSRIESAEILSRLVIYLFHPLSEDNTRLRQVLHVFFPFFASMSMRNQQQLEEAFLPTLQTFLNAPITNPLAEVDIAMVVKMFVDLTQVKILDKFYNLLNNKY